MKERFSKLLLGEDMSGCGNGVSTALAISNAITNLCGILCIKFSVFCVITNYCLEFSSDGLSLYDYYYF